MLTYESLLQKLFQGDSRALAKLITRLLDAPPQELPSLPPFSRSPELKVHIIGFTGPGSAGKSTLIGLCTSLWLAEEKRVGILAIDPSSLKTKGAFLGDRIRIPHEHYVHPNFFMRSLATRGAPEGLVRNLRTLIKAVALNRRQKVIVETVGSGQDAVAIRKHVQTLIYVLPPTGDAITFMKSGLMEVADIVVVTHGEKPESLRVERAVKDALALSPPKEGWPQKVLRINVTTKEGITELLAYIEEHRQALQLKTA